MKFFLLFLCITPFFASAAKVTCEPGKLEDIYRKDDKMFILIEGMPWHLVGYKSDSDITQKSHKIYKAKTKDRLIELTFDNASEEICMQETLSVPISKIKVKK